MSYKELGEQNKATSEANAARLIEAIKKSEYDYKVVVVPVTFAVAILGKDGKEIAIDDKIKILE